MAKKKPTWWAYSAVCDEMGAYTHVLGQCSAVSAEEARGKALARVEELADLPRVRSLLVQAMPLPQKEIREHEMV